MVEKTENASYIYVNTDCSPSHLFNNLSIYEKKIIYIHNSEIQPRIIVIDAK